MKASSLLLAVVFLAGCTSGAETEAETQQVGPLLYGVSYTVGADQYDDADAARRYGRCAALPGAKEEGVDQSLPPGRILRFVGSKAEQTAVVECLNALPDAKVNGPFEPPAQ